MLYAFEIANIKKKVPFVSELYYDQYYICLNISYILK